MSEQQPLDSRRSRRLGYASVTFSTLGAALATVVGKWNLQAISPLLMNCFIFTTATAALSLVWLPFRGLRSVFRLSRPGWMWLGLFTATSYAAIWTFWAGVQRMDPSLAAFLNRSEVPIAIALGIVFLKERFTLWELLGIALSVAGIVVMKLTLRWEYSAGFWLVLIGSAFFGITEFVSKIALRHVEPVVLAYLRNLLMAAGYWVVFAAGSRSFAGLDQVWYGVLALGLIGPLWSRLMYLVALRRLELSRVATISQGQPVFVILIALLALGQLPTVREITGGVLIVLGCILMIWSRPRRTAQT